MRKETLLTINDDGMERRFRIRQMSAIKLERWLNKAALLLAAGLPEGGGIASLERKLRTGSFGLDDFLTAVKQLDYDKAEPLYNELLECCEHIPDKNNLNFAQPLTVENADAIISSAMTLYRLRYESAKLNLSGFFDALPSQSQNAPEAEIKFTKRTKTSAAKSERS